MKHKLLTYPFVVTLALLIAVFGMSLPAESSPTVRQTVADITSQGAEPLRDGIIRGRVIPADGRVLDVTRTDADGWYSFAPPSSGAYQLRVLDQDKQELALAAGGQIVVRQADLQVEHTLSLARSATGDLMRQNERERAIKSLPAASEDASGSEGYVTGQVTAAGTGEALSSVPVGVMNFHHANQVTTDGPSLCYAIEGWTDSEFDVELEHVDVTEVYVETVGEQLTARFHLRNLPETLVFNRVGVPEDALEYGWGVDIDVDNNSTTGNSAGFDYELSHTVYVFNPDSPVTAPIGNRGQVNIWESETGLNIEDAQMNVNIPEKTITLFGRIPGLTETSRITFWTYDYAPNRDNQQRDKPDNASGCGGRIAPSLAPIVNPVTNSGSPAVALMWDRIHGAGSYEVQISTDNTFPNRATTNETFTTREPTLTVVKDIGAYFFRVRGCNSGGCSPYSDMASFTVTTSPKRIFLPSVIR